VRKKNEREGGKKGKAFLWGGGVITARDCGSTQKRWGDNRLEVRRKKDG